MKQRRQFKCPSCGLVVVVERDSGTVIASHEVPQCRWFENMLRTEMGTPDSVDFTVLEVDP